MKSLTIIFALCLAVIFFTKISGQAPDTVDTKIYMLDRVLHCLIPISHTVESGSAEDVARATLEVLTQKMNADSDLLSYFSGLNGQISVRVQGETAHVTLEKCVLDACPDGSDEKKLFLGQLVATLCAIPEINYVKFEIDGGNITDFPEIFTGQEIFSANFVT